MKTIVDSKKRSKYNLEIKELVQFKDLFLVLGYRDLRVRYAQTFLGLFWAILQPTVTLVILTIVFGYAINIDTKNIPYPVFAISGVAIWSYFSFVLSQSGQSIVGAQAIIKKVYFPRLIIPLSKAIVGLVDFIVALIILIILMLIYQIPPSTNLIFVPVILMVNIMTALGVGIWMSALTIRYRDFQHVVPFLVQFGLYVSPIAYPASIITEKYLWLYNLNPMVGIIEAFRWSLFGGEFHYEFVMITLPIAIALFISSLIYFKNVEYIMADIV